MAKIPTTRRERDKLLKLPRYRGLLAKVARDCEVCLPTVSKAWHWHASQRLRAAIEAEMDRRDAEAANEVAV